MPIAIFYWITLFLWLLAALWWGTSAEPTYRYHVGVWGVVLFLLFLLIGMKLFGAPIKGG